MVGAGALRRESVLTCPGLATLPVPTLCDSALNLGRPGQGVARSGLLAVKSSGLVLVPRLLR